MGSYSQAGRPLTVTTPLGDDVLLVTGLAGHEAISQLYSFELALAAPDAARVAFDRLMGEEVTVHLALPDGRSRHFSGICSGLCQGMRMLDVTSFTMEIVPSFWRLTRRVQSRIFQRMSVPAILRAVLADVPDVEYELDDAYPEHEYCVQYRESDHDFACRLMEEEGIYFYFIHEADRHRMILSDKPQFPRLEPDKLVLQEAGTDVIDEQRITRWEKRQRLRSGRVTLRDHTFELPHDPLESSATTPESVQVGRVSHRLAVGGNERMELYQWPGEYARRFDSVDHLGHSTGKASLSDKVLPDGRRTAEIRMQQEASEAIVLHGSSLYRHLVPGHTFQLTEQDRSGLKVRSANDGEYVLTSVGHRIEAALDFRSGEGSSRLYLNSFTCIPADVTYRPPRVTPKPVIAGPQTAVVVKGPEDDEIHTEEFGRVKVKFHWDRDGRASSDSSCWIRVSQPSAGGGFGMVFIPRGGQEVVVHFEDGDPDHPIITGAVYNPNQMPPFKLPAGKMIGGFRSNTYPGGGGLNEISVDDSGKVERMYVHAQYNKDEVVGYRRTAKVGDDSTETVGNNVSESVGNDKTVSITANSVKKIGANETKEVTANSVKKVGANETKEVAGNQTGTTGGNQAQTTGADATETVAGKKTIKVGSDLTIEAGTSITFKCGASTIKMNQGGVITVSGTVMTMTAMAVANIAAPLTNIAGGVMLNLVGAITTLEGLVTHVGGAALARVDGGKIDLMGGSEVIIQGGMIKLN